MKNLYIALLLSASQAGAQYCLPVASPYASSMPGITSFSLNTIFRTSDDLENMSNSFVVTGMSTTLEKGQTYTIAINHTVDAAICPDMNLRVWIDYNQDFEFEDPGETVLTVDHHLPGLYSASFTVPLTVATGTTRLRATAKMSNLGGHTLPTPCNIPADPLGYHGEIEDYEVVIINTTGIEETAFDAPLLYQTETGQIALNYKLNKNATVSFALFGINGKLIEQATEHAVSSGSHSHIFDVTANNGIYILNMIIDDHHLTEKLVIAR